MLHKKRNLPIGAIPGALLASVFLAAATLGVAETPPNTVLDAHNDNMGVSVYASSDHDILAIRLQVAGPEGFRVEQRVEDSFADWSPQGELQDGFYTWQARVITVKPGAPVRQIRDPQSSISAISSARPEMVDTLERDATMDIKIETYFHESDLRTETISGDFQVQGGSIIPVDKSHDSLSRQSETGYLNRAIGAVLDFLIPSAQAADLEATGTFPQVIWNRDATTYDDYKFRAASAHFRLVTEDDESTQSTVYFYRNSPSFNLVVRGGQEHSTLNTPRIGIGTATPDGSIHVDSRFPEIKLENNLRGNEWMIRNRNSYELNEARFEITSGVTFDANGATINSSPFAIEPPDGESSFAEAQHNALYIDEIGNIGMGTDEPSTNLDIRGLLGISLASIELGQSYNVSGGTPLFGSKRFRISESGGNSDIFRIDGGAPSNSIRVASSGNVGVGTNSPQAPVHVVRDNNTAEFQIQDSGDALFSQALMRLASEAHPRFRFDNTSEADYRWEIGTFGKGNNESLVAFKVGSGMVQMRVFANGDAEFEGDVTANGVLLTSTREAKTDFAPLDVNDVLERLSTLEISKWRYKHEDTDTVHFGPVAEEFHETFGLSDGKHLNMIDTNGITFAAIQALNQKNQELRTENRELMTRLERLESALDI